LGKSFKNNKILHYYWHIEYKLKLGQSRSVGFLGWVFLGGCTQKNSPNFFWVRTQVSEPCNIRLYDVSNEVKLNPSGGVLGR